MLRSKPLEKGAFVPQPDAALEINGTVSLIAIYITFQFSRGPALLDTRVSPLPPMGEASAKFEPRLTKNHAISIEMRLLSGQ